LVEELLESLREPLQLLLIGVGVLSIIWGEVRDGVAIFVIILAVASIKTWSERRARRALDALQRLFAPHARVRRNGVTVDVATQDVVPGDILELQAGAIVAADARVLTAAGLSVDESAQTGEPVAAAKGPSAAATDAPLAARSSNGLCGHTGCSRERHRGRGHHRIGQGARPAQHDGPSSRSPRRCCSGPCVSSPRRSWRRPDSRACSCR
jgi:P-type Ca2+ transporter type 2C